MTYITGPNNELLYDGTYNYEYDADGNQIARWVQATSNAGQTAPASRRQRHHHYTWDNRNRLTSVTTYQNYDDAKRPPKRSRTRMTFSTVGSARLSQLLRRQSYVGRIRRLRL